MKQLLFAVYIGVTLASALISLILCNMLTSKSLITYYLAMYDGEVVDEELGEMPDHVKGSVTRMLQKHGRNRVENCKKTIKDYIAITIIAVLPAVVPILNVVLLVEEFKIYHAIVGLYDRAKEYNREAVN